MELPAIRYRTMVLRGQTASSRLPEIKLLNLSRGGFLPGLCAGKIRDCGGEDPFAPDLALLGIEPLYSRANFRERIGGEEFFEDCFNALLEGAVFGAEAVGDDAFGVCWDAD